MLNDYRQLIAGMKTTPWLITEESLEMIVEIVNMRLSGEAFSDEEINARLEAVTDENRQNPRVQVDGGIGVVAMYGPMFPKANLMTEISGATSLETFRNDLASLVENDKVKQIVLDMDTPGGAAAMVPETGKAIRAAAEVKPVYAIANTLACSGGLWLASQATEFYATESAKVGSLGVYHIVEDNSVAEQNQGRKIKFISAGKFKTAGNPHEPLTDEAEAYIQEGVDEIQDEFINAVAEGRGLEPAYVRQHFGDAKIHSAKKAAEIKMIDGVMSMDSLLGELLSDNNSSSQSQTVGALGSAVRNMHRNGGELLSLEEFSEPSDVRDHSDLNPDESAEQGWRRETPPAGEDGSVPDRSNTVTKPNGGEMSITEEQLTTFCEVLDLPADSDADVILAKVTSMNEELAPLRDMREQLEAKKQFAEDYPDEAKRLSELEEDSQKQFAKSFSESFESRRVTKKVGEGDEAKDEATTLGFSSRVIESIHDCTKLFSEGKPEFDSFKNVLDSIMENGVVDYGNKGSDIPVIEEDEVVVTPGTKSARVAFHERVLEIQENDSLDFNAALAEATKRHPKLAEAWREANVVSA